MKRTLWLTLLALFFCSPAAGKNLSYKIVDDVTVSTAGGAHEVTFVNPYSNTLYLTYTFGDEVPAAIFQLTVYLETEVGDVLIFTGGTLGSGQTRNILIGSQGSSAGGLTATIDFPATRLVKFVFTVTGAGASFDVSAWVETVGIGAP